MERSLLFSALGLGLVLFACSGTTLDEGPVGASEDDLSKARAACLNKACGDSCSLCPPGATNCFETAVLKQCNASGRCTSAPSQCALDAGPAPVLDAGPGPGDAIDAGPAPYQPCAGKMCGASCSICPPWDATCVETAVLKFCHPGGECKDMPPACIPPPPYQPCAGKACGDACTQCSPADPTCTETAVVKACDAAGACTAAGTFTCK